MNVDDAVAAYLASGRKITRLPSAAAAATTGAIDAANRAALAARNAGPDDEDQANIRRRRWRGYAGKPKPPRLDVVNRTYPPVVR